MKTPRKRKAPLAVFDFERLLELWQSEMTKDELIKAFNTTRYCMEQAKIDLALPHRSTRKSWHRPHVKRRKYKWRGDGSEISEEELRHRMAQVQATWTDEVFSMRSKDQFRHVPFTYEVYAMRMAAKRR